MSDSLTKEIHIFSDASKEAIGAVAYLKMYDVNGTSTLSFLLGKSKVAPRHGHTIPRLELCAAVLSAEMADVLLQQLDIQAECLHFFTDSRVVLGYICNEKRRFHVYVANRIDRIRQSSQPKQWNYVPSNINPADQATRSVTSLCYSDSLWLRGPDVLSQSDTSDMCDSQLFSLVDPDNDKEVRAELKSTKTSVSIAAPQQLATDRFTRFSSWKKLVKTISHLKHIARSFTKTNSSCVGWHQCKDFRNVEGFKDAEVFIVKAVQREAYSEEIMCLQNQKPLPRKSSILSLSPALDEQGVLRVGGRLKNSKLTACEIHPIIIPKRNHVAKLLVHHYHDRVRHQGRHLTEGALKSAGYWIIGAKRLVSSLISKCVTCNRLRRKPETQMMSDLPPDRLVPCPPFTYVGVDAFGPWEIVTRRTRGGSANSKRWAILFTCLMIRAVHIELVEEMTSSSFINCLRRFIALRGEVKQFRSDRGTNFIGAIESLNVTAVNVEDGPVQDFLYNNGVVWLFNTPHSSHMGGVWERMIGTSRRILDAMLLNTKRLTHEVLSTLMAEVTAIINARPITSITTDPEQPMILSPAMLLTQKTAHTPNFDLSLDVKNICKSQWMYVQTLAEEFWRRWRLDYLQSLQTRSKWKISQPNLQEGDVVLVKDNCARNEWPLGVVETVFPGQDNLVRKAAIRVYKNDKCVTYNRPVVNLVRLF
ncbi:uncharacterized protein LOC125377955 [Haliotis rufescens]|uniref:uncharacterized protein LOC125377955 n=1 Tax=Haliotis rufescens TaxID=6454 RepID=UPI00201F39E7|nr:uncharacterized protein LOC125377955 [Haliotis rufescens]